MTGPRDSSFTAIAIRSISGQSTSKAAEDIAKSRILLANLPKSGMPSCGSERFPITWEQRPNDWSAIWGRRVCCHSLSRNPNSEAKPNTLDLKRGKGRDNTSAASWHAFRFERSGGLVTMKELTPRIPAQHRTVSRILTVPRVLGTRCLSMFTSGGQLREGARFRR